MRTVRWAGCDLGAGTGKSMNSNVAGIVKLTMDGRSNMKRLGFLLITVRD